LEEEVEVEVVFTRENHRPRSCPSRRKVRFCRTATRLSRRHFCPPRLICSASQDRQPDAKQAMTDQGVLREDAFLRLKAIVIKAINIHRDNFRHRISQYEAALAEISRLQDKLLEHNSPRPRTIYNNRTQPGKYREV